MLGAGLFSLLGGLPAPMAGASRTLEVGPGSPYTTIAAALADAVAGDTIRVAGGLYRERLRIEFPVTLIGENWPVVDAGGTGHVVDARASNGPDFVAGYRGAEATCAAPTVDRAAVRISPYPATDDWFVEIPCSRIR